MYQSKIGMKWASLIIGFIKRLQCKNNIQAITNCQIFRFRLLVFSQAMLKNFLYFTLLLLLNQVVGMATFQPVTRNNLVLAGRVYQMLYVGEWLSCIQACYDDPRCTSYNYGISAADNGLCELNDCGFQDWCERDTKYLIYFPNFVFQEIRKCQVFPLFFPVIKD